MASSALEVVTAVAKGGPRRVGHWIRGAAVVDAPAYYKVRNPANDDVVAEVADGDASTVDEAIRAAQEAYPAWRDKPVEARAKILRRWYDLVVQRSDALGRLISLENGKPLGEAVAEVRYGASFIEWFSEEARRAYGDVIPTGNEGDRRAIVLRQPLGGTGTSRWQHHGGASERADAAVGVGAGRTGHRSWRARRSVQRGVRQPGERVRRRLCQQPHGAHAVVHWQHSRRPTAVGAVCAERQTHRDGAGRPGTADRVRRRGCGVHQPQSHLRAVGRVRYGGGAAGGACPACPRRPGAGIGHGGRPAHPRGRRRQSGTTRAGLCAARRASVGRRQAHAGVGRQLLRAHRVARRATRCAGGARGDLRAGDRGDAFRDRGRGGAAGQRYRVRPVELRVHPRPRTGVSHGATAGGWHCGRERRCGQQRGHAVRRGEAERPRPRRQQVRFGFVYQPEIRADAVLSGAAYQVPR
eukprot:ctg_1892.g707